MTRKDDGANMFNFDSETKSFSKSDCEDNALHNFFTFSSDHRAVVTASSPSGRDLFSFSAADECLKQKLFDQENETCHVPQAGEEDVDKDFEFSFGVNASESFRSKRESEANVFSLSLGAVSGPEVGDGPFRFF